MTFLHWLAVHLGVDAPGDVFYNWWSGAGSDIGELSILVAIGATARHHNCHVKGCLRLGRPVAGTHYLACPRHHPEHPGKRRSVSFAILDGAHRANKPKEST